MPGHAFTRRMYSKFSGDNFQKLKPHHHIRLDIEFKMDCKIWESFLSDLNRSIVRPFIDLTSTISAERILFYSDASANPELGFGAIFGDSWTFGKMGSWLCKQM